MLTWLGIVFGTVTAAASPVPSGCRCSIVRGALVLIFALSAGTSPPVTAQAKGDDQSSDSQTLTPEHATLSLSWKANGILDQSRNGDATGRGSGQAKADFTLDFTERLVDVSSGTGSGTVVSKVDYQEHTVLADTSQSCEETRIAPNAERNDLVQLYVIEDQDVPGNLHYRIDLIVDIQCEMTVSNDAVSLPSSNDFQILHLSVEGSFPRNSRSVAINTENLSEMSWPFLGFDYLGGEYTDVVVNGVLTLLEPAALAVSPSDGFKTHGDEKGNLNPANKTYTLTNTGESPIHFTVTKSQPWLTASSSSGTLAPKQSTKVTLSVSQKLAPDTYKDQLKFANTTNGYGDTSRDVVVEIGEYQTWDIKLTGNERDDMGGALMYAKVNDAWRYVTFDYGVRFNYVLTARIVLKKVKGKWTYASGTIKSAAVTPVPVFDPTVFAVVLPVKCRNCQAVPEMAGQSLSGSVDATASTVSLTWPSVITHVSVRNQLKLKHSSLQKSHQGYSENYFQSSDFFHRASDQNIPLRNGHHNEKVALGSHKDRSRLDKRPPISLFYTYYMEKVH